MAGGQSIVSSKTANRVRGFDLSGNPNNGDILIFNSTTGEYEPGAPAGGYVHPNHSGEVTSVGDGAQTAQPTIISNKTTLGSLSGTEEFLINDGGVLKKVLASNVGGSIYTADGTIGSGRVATLTDSLTFDGGANTSSSIFIDKAAGPQVTIGYNADGGRIALVNGSATVGIVNINSSAYDFFNTGKNFGIGETAPNSKLVVKSTAASDRIEVHKSTGVQAAFGYGADGGRIALVNSAVTTDIVRINSSTHDYINTGKNFGIGETTPTAKLQVKGINQLGTSTALLVQDGAGTPNDLLKVANDGSTTLSSATHTIGNSTGSPRIDMRGSVNSGLNLYQGATRYISLFTGGGGGGALNLYDTGGALQTNLNANDSSNFRKKVNFGTVTGSSGGLVNIYATTSTPFLIYDSTGVTNIMRVLSSGNIGINEGNPTAKLHVNGSTLLDGTLQINDGTQANGYVLTSDASGNASWQVASGADGNGIYDGGGSLVANTAVLANGFNFKVATTGDSDNFWIDATSNNVGVGIRPTISGLKFDVNGNIGFNGVVKSRANTTGEKFVAWDNGASGVYGLGVSQARAATEIYTPTNTGKITFGKGNQASFTEYARFDVSGNLGIGTTTPTAKLHVKGTGATSGTTALLVQNGAGTPADLLKVLDDGSTTINGGTTINGNLKVDSSAASDNLDIRKSNVLQARLAYINGGGGYLQLFNSTASTSEALIGFGIDDYINTGANFTIGAASGTSKLTVNSTDASDNIALRKSGSLQATMAYSSSGGYLQLIDNLAASKMLIGFGGNDYINTGQDFGIGTTTPTAKLHVNGSTLLDGNLGVFGTTPIAQPTTAIVAPSPVGGGGTATTDTDTYEGYTMSQVVKALRNLGILA